MARELILRTPDHPEANGRRARPGEREYEMSFPLEDGRVLILKYGQKGFDSISQVILDMLAESPI